MLFNSLQFMIFLPIVVLVYYIIPDKLKMYWLLVASYYFYMCWNVKYVVLILASTIITYVSGIFIEKIKQSGNEKRKKCVVAVCVLLNLVILFYFKYINFIVRIISMAFGVAHIELNIPEFDIILPVGISFYTFQALSYTIDVYRDKIKAEKNFFRYALFVSFFPQLVAGPIERSGNLLSQLKENHKFSYENAREGILLMLWGFFLKLVLADRIGIFVDTVYGAPEDYAGCYLAVATVLFAFQIYCDFYGYSTIALGAAKMLGITLMENFDAPYFSTSVAEFWRKWHISLTSWFKDYLYIPLGGSKKGKARKYFNKLIVFLASGLWHGAGWHYIVWGGLNGLYQVIGEALEPFRAWFVKIFNIHRSTIGHKTFQMCVTFALVDFSWIFFRASDLNSAYEIVISIFTKFEPWMLWNEAFYDCGLDSRNFWVMIVGIIILLFADLCKRRGISVRAVICGQDCWLRLIIIDVAFIAILLLGIWGSTYDAAEFIYFQF